MPLLGLAARLIGGGALKKAGRWLGRQALGAARATGARTIGGAIARTAGGAVVATAATSAAGRAYDRLTRGRLQPPPGFAPQGGGGFPAPRPREGVVGRTISRVLPGGMSGREFTPYGDAVDKLGRPLAVYPEEIAQMRGPKGYVVVPWEGEMVAVQKRVAISLGLYNPPPKPPVSGYDLRAINRAASARKRVAKLAKKVGMKGCKRGC